MADILKQKIQLDMKEAMRNKQTVRLAAIRMLMAAIKQREIDDQITLDDVGIIAVVNKMIKQRRDSAEQFQAAQRLELVEKEKEEIAVLQMYLPKSLSEAEIDAEIEAAIKSTQASSVKDIGKVMGFLKPKLTGRADMSYVSTRVKERLS